MNTDLATITKRWKDLSEEDAGNSLAARYRIGGTHRFGIFLLIRYPSQAPAIEMGPVKPDIIKSSPFPFMKGIDLHLVTEAGECFLAMDLKQPKAIDVFLTLAARLCQELASEQLPITAYGIVIDVLKHWQQFFSPERKALSQSEQTGLAGELVFMSQVLDKGIPQHTVLKSWKGSDKSHHDFQFQRLAIEVKATTAVNTELVSISSLRQLESLGTETLYLSQVALDVHEHGDTRLPDLVDHLRDVFSASSIDQLLFEEKLVKGGYRGEDVQHYYSPSYTLRRIRTFEVDAEFPKITTRDVVDGVLDATYRISLAGVSKKSLNFEKVVCKLKDVSNG